MKAITMGALAQGFGIYEFDELTSYNYTDVIVQHSNRYFYDGDIEDDDIISYVSNLETGIKVIGVFNKRELTFKVLPYDESDRADSIDDWSGQDALDWFTRQQQRAKNVTGYFIPEVANSPVSYRVGGAIIHGEILKKLVEEGKTYDEIIAFLDSISCSVDDNNRYVDTWEAIEEDTVPENFYHLDELPDCIYTNDPKEQRKVFRKYYKRLHKIWSVEFARNDDDRFVYSYFSKFINQATLNECIHIIEMYDPQESNRRIKNEIEDYYRLFSNSMYHGNEQLANTLINRVYFRTSERIKQLIGEDLDTMSEGYYKYVKEQLQHTDIELPKFKMVINHKCLGNKAPKQEFNKELKKAR